MWVAKFDAEKKRLAAVWASAPEKVRFFGEGVEAQRAEAEG